MNKLKLHIDLAGCAVGYSPRSVTSIMTEALKARNEGSDARFVLTDFTGRVPVADVLLTHVIAVSTLNVA